VGAGAGNRPGYPSRRRYHDASPGRGSDTSPLLSLCRSVVTREPVTIQRDAAITILSVRQQSVGRQQSRRELAAVHRMVLGLAA